MTAWLKNLVPLSQPIRNNTRTDCDLLASIFSSLAPATCNVFASCSELFIGLHASVVISQSDYFGFGFLTLIILKTALY